MGLIQSIPLQAMPVVEVLRKEEKPKELPFIPERGASLRWLRPNQGNITCCAMGLFSQSSNYPNDAEDFDGKAPDDAVAAFGAWFDQQTDPQATVDAIWPDQTIQKGKTKGPKKLI